MIGETNPNDIEVIRTFVQSQAGDAFVQSRFERNVVSRAESFVREKFWFVVVGCVITTQQRSGRGSAVKRLLDRRPFPLALDSCDGSRAESAIREVLVQAGGIRFTTNLPQQISENLRRLK